MIPGDKAYYPGTDVLVNRYDIRSAADARSAEYKYASFRELQLAHEPIKGKFDFEHLKAIHQHLFQDMYTWAGQPREIELAQRNRETGLAGKFVPVAEIQSKAEEFSASIAAKNNLKGLSKPEFIKELAEVYSKMNELHAFREGNDRATRVFLQGLAKEAGHDLDLTKIDKVRWDKAAHLSMPQHNLNDSNDIRVANRMEMRQIFHESTKPTIEHAFVFEDRKAAIAQYPVLKEAYARFDDIKAQAARFDSPDLQERFVATAKGRIAAKLKDGSFERDIADPADRMAHSWVTAAPATAPVARHVDPAVKNVPAPVIAAANAARSAKASSRDDELER